MPRTLFVLLPVVAVSLFTLLMPAKAVAELPSDGSGEMVVDEVCEGLRQYRRETDSVMRSRLLTKLAPTRDPRVAVLLGDELYAGSLEERLVRVLWLDGYYLPPRSNRPTSEDVYAWWEKNRDDLRRRAKQLPQ